MSDEQDPGIDPEADARIRAMLADAGSDTTPIPAEVASRLDETLARLVAERDEAAVDATTAENVVPLRRRWGQRATVAAAAVVVLGLGGAAVGAMGGFGGIGDSVDSKVTAESGGSADEDTNGLADAPPSARAPLSSPGAQDPSSPDAAKEALPAVRSASFAEDVTLLLSARTGLTAPGEPSTGGREQPSEISPQPPTDSFVDKGDCPGPQVYDGAETNVVTYDGALAALVVHPVEDGSRLVEAWTCAGDTRLATATVAP